MAYTYRGWKWLRMLCGLFVSNYPTRPTRSMINWTNILTSIADRTIAEIAELWSPNHLRIACWDDYGITVRCGQEQGPGHRELPREGQIDGWGEMAYPKEHYRGVLRLHDPVHSLPRHGQPSILHKRQGRLGNSLPKCHLRCNCRELYIPAHSGHSSTNGQMDVVLFYAVLRSLYW